MNLIFFYKSLKQITLLKKMLKKIKVQVLKYCDSDINVKNSQNKIRREKNARNHRVQQKFIIKIQYEEKRTDETRKCDNELNG